MSHVIGERFSEVNRQPVRDHKFSVCSVNVDAAPHNPPIAICVNHDARYGDDTARSVPYVVTARVRRNESLTIRGRSTRIGGSDKKNDFRNGERYSSRCTKLLLIRSNQGVQVGRKKRLGYNEPRSLLQ